MSDDNAKNTIGCLVWAAILIVAGIFTYRGATTPAVHLSIPTATSLSRDTSTLSDDGQYSDLVDQLERDAIAHEEYMNELIASVTEESIENYHASATEAAEEVKDWATEQAEIFSCVDGCTEYPTWCTPAIKGNISYNTGEKIYHVSGQAYYEATQINTTKGERWFCTDEEAQAAGWRRSKE